MTEHPAAPLLPDGEGAEGAPDEERARSILFATWFRAVLVVSILSVIGFLLIPYVAEEGYRPRLPRPRIVGAVTTPVPMPPALSASSGSKVSAALSGARVAATAEETSRAPRVIRARPAAKEPAARSATPLGSFWVQVGAFKTQEAARQLVAKLRALNFPVEESLLRESEGRSPSAAVDHYDVIVSGARASAIAPKLAGRGLSTQSGPDGVRITPRLSLVDAVALSRDLAVDGFTVQVRQSSPRPRGQERVGPRAGAEPLHRVRIGAFRDRAAAMVAAGQLEAKGYVPFITRDRE